MALNKEGVKTVLQFWGLLLLVSGYVASTALLAYNYGPFWLFTMLIPLLGFMTYGVYKDGSK